MISASLDQPVASTVWLMTFGVATRACGRSRCAAYGATSSGQRSGHPGLVSNLTTMKILSAPARASIKCGPPLTKKLVTRVATT